MLNRRSPSSFSEAKNIKIKRMIPPVFLWTTVDNGQDRLGGRHRTFDSNAFTDSFSIGPAEKRTHEEFGLDSRVLKSVIYLLHHTLTNLYWNYTDALFLYSI